MRNMITQYNNIRKHTHTQANAIIIVIRCWALI